MSEKEKKAIEDLIKEIIILRENSNKIIDSKELLNYKETLLKLITRQKQELEKEKEKNKEAGVILGKRIKICNEFQLELEKEKEKNKELSEHADNLLGEKEYYQDCYDGITFKINNLISQIESAIDFMKTDKSKIKVDMYQQKEEDLKLEIVHLKKLLKEE